MTKTHHKTGKPVLVAIDIAEHRNEVLIAVPGRRRRKRLTVRNEREDINRFVETLSAFGMPVQVEFEPTGDCHRPLARRLHRAGSRRPALGGTALADHAAGPAFRNAKLYRPHCVCVKGSELSRKNLFQNLVVQGEIGKRLAQATVFRLHVLHPLGLADLKSAILLSPVVIRLLG